MDLYSKQEVHKVVPIPTWEKNCKMILDFGLVIQLAYVDELLDCIVVLGSL